MPKPFKLRPIPVPTEASRENRKPGMNRKFDRNTGRARGGVATVVGCLIVIGGLLVLPVMGLRKAGVDFRWAAAYGVLINVLTYWQYARDKRRAQEGEWRVPEVRLHLLELFGGWPGALLAQRRLRHKCSKSGYQAAFWLIVLASQFAAFDSLQDWRYSRAAMHWVGRNAGHGK
jgi:uncharacterized membrane protein YsdA (DUF1294 family)